MSFDEEWQRIQAGVTARQTHMQLNQLDAEGGGGTADLSVNADDLGLVGNNAHELRERLGKDGRHAQSSTAAAATALSGDNFRTGPALKTVHDTWDSQLKTLLDACAHISNHLDYTTAQHAKDEADISESFTSLSVSRINEFFK